MQDLTLMQAQHRIADYHRMMARVNGEGGAATPSARRTGIHIAVAQALLFLAAQLASPMSARRVM